MKHNKITSVKQIVHNRKYLRLRGSNLSTKACSSWCAKCTWHSEGGCEGGGGGDGGGGDPVEEEPSLPLLVHLQACRVLHRYFFILSLEGGRLNRSFWFHPLQGDGSPLPACAGGNGCWGDVADGSSLQGWGRGARADKKQLGLPHHLLTHPEMFGSVLRKYKRKGTHTALPRKARTRMSWFILNVGSCLLFFNTDSTSKESPFIFTSGEICHDKRCTKYLLFTSSFADLLTPQF